MKLLPLARQTPVLLAALASKTARAELSAEDLTKLVQNPDANQVSVPVNSEWNIELRALMGASVSRSL